MQQFDLPERLQKRLTDLNERVGNLQREFESLRTNFRDIIETFVIAQGIDPANVHVELGKDNKVLSVKDKNEEEE